MAIVPKSIRPFVKRTSIPAAKAAAQKWLASVTTATNAPEHRKSALRARLDYGRSLSRTTPMKEALSSSSLPSDDLGNLGNLGNSAINQPISPETQIGQPESELSSSNFLMVMNRLSEPLLNEPIQIVFEPNVLATLRDTSRTEGLLQTSQLVDTALQGQPVITRTVKSTMESELGQLGQLGQSSPAQGTQVAPVIPDRLNVLQSKIAQAQRNPFVNVNQRELAELYDLDSSSVDNLIGGGQSGI